MAKNITKIKHRFPLKQIRLIPKAIAHSWPVLGLICIGLILTFLNYEPNTWLIGWDNLHPEFNFTLDLKRAFFGVWQEYRGLGLLAGMAQAADLPRSLFLLLLKTIGLPTSSLRYFWTFLMLILGPLGVYTTLYALLFKSKFDQPTRQVASFFGGLFYLLNLSTAQNFFVPFETFTSLFGFMPWIIFFILRYLNHPSTAKLFALFFVSLLASPSFYVETIFIVLVLCLAPIFVIYTAGAKFSFKSIKNSLLCLISLVVPHLFWLLPIVFFVLTNGKVGTEAKINLISSPETFERNLQFTTLSDFALLKGYLMNFVDANANLKYDYLLKVWRDHLNNPIITIFGYLNFALIATGFAYAHKKRIPFIKGFTGFSAVCFFFLMGGVLLFMSKIPLVGELFRSPFTKFSIPLSYTYSIFFAVGTIFILDLFSYLHSRLTYILTTFTLFLVLVAFSSPSFSGYLISPTMRLNLPSAYTDMFKYFQSLPTGRIANFPQSSFWGWLYYDWGYRGSGFIWHGLPQALLDRAFDVWGKSNEIYYEQLNQAIFSGDQKSFEDIIDRYAINWLIVDRSVISPDPKVSTYTDETLNMIESSNRFTLSKSFGNQLMVYQTKPKVNNQNFISITPPPTSETLLNLSYRPENYTIKDNAIQITSSILSDSNLKLPSPTIVENLLPVAISYRKDDNIVIFKLEPILPQITIGMNSVSPSINPSYLSFAVPSGTNNLILELDKHPYELQLPGEINSQSIYYPLTTAYLSTKNTITASLYDAQPVSEIDVTTALTQSTPYQCYTHKSNRQIEKIVSDNSISLLGTDVVGCLSLPLSPYINTSGDQLLSFSYRYSSPTFTPANVSVSSSTLDPTTLPQALEPKKDFTFIRQFAFSKGQPLQLNLILEANEVKSVQEIRYQSITIATHTQLDSTTFQLESIPSLTTPVSKNSRVTITLPITDSIYTDHQTPSHNSLSPTTISCDQFHSDYTNKTANEEGFWYESRNATTCDYLNLRHLPHSTSYALILDHEHFNGLTPTICLENFTTRRCDVHERLTDTDKPQVIFQTISNPSEDSGYTFHYFNQSFNYRPSRNLLKSMTITPISLRYIQNITLEKNDNKPTPTISNIQTTHPAEFLYTASFKSINDSQLNLYQSYSPHWYALKVDESFSHLPLWQQIIYIPLHFSSASISNQSSWHNSWQFNSDTYHLAIFYFPQYLEFLGFIILIFAFLLFLFAFIISKIHHHKSKK